MKYKIKFGALILLSNLLACKSGSKKPIKDTLYLDTLGQPQHTTEPVQHLLDESNGEDSLSKPGSTKLIFSGYTIIVHDFKIYDEFDNNGKIIYGIYPKEAYFNSNKNRIVTLTMLKDTFHTSINTYSTFYKNQVEIIPQNKDDKFEVDFSFQIGVYGQEDTKHKAKVNWYGMTNFTPMTDSSGYFFRLPSDAFDSDFIRNDLRKKISIKDTSILYKGEVSTEATILYKNTPCVVDEKALYLRIHRLNNGRLVDTKFIRIDLPYID